MVIILEKTFIQLVNSFYMTNILYMIYEFWLMKQKYKT